MGIPETTNHKVIDWCNVLREVCERDLEENAGPIGGLNENGFCKIVEINESNFFHREYHRGQWRPGYWASADVERQTRICFLVEMADRREDTLFAIIGGLTKAD